MSLQQELEAAARRVHFACIKVSGSARGDCREASILLVELLLANKTVESACLCQGKYHGRPHCWTRVAASTPIGLERWIVDPTICQFDAAGKFVCQESSGGAYVEESYVYFCQARLAKLRRALG